MVSNFEHFFLIFVPYNCWSFVLLLRILCGSPCPFFQLNWLFVIEYFLICWYSWDINPSQKVCLQIFGCLFTIIDHFICCAKALEFDITPFLKLPLVVYSLGILSKKLSLTSISWIVSPTFFFRNFIFSGTKFKSLSHLALTFICRERNESNIILPHLYLQVCQHRLLKRLSLSNCVVLVNLSKTSWLYVLD